MGIVLATPTLDVSGKMPQLQFPNGTTMSVNAKQALALLANAESNGAALLHARARAKSTGRRARRSAEDIAKDLERIRTTLRANKKTGMNASALSEALGLDREQLAGPLHMGLKSHVLSKKGQKRATVYYFRK